MLVTNRDTVVAEIVPPSPDVILAGAMLEGACRKGLITPAASPTEAIPPRDAVMTYEELMREMEKSRQDR